MDVMLQNSILWQDNTLCCREFIMSSSHQDLIWGTFSGFLTRAVFIINPQSMILRIWWRNKVTRIIFRLQISGSLRHLSRDMAEYLYSGLASRSRIGTLWISSMPMDGKTFDPIIGSFSRSLAYWCKSHFYWNFFLCLWISD